MADKTFYFYRTPSGRELLMCEVNCTLPFQDEYACRYCCNSPSSCGLADREFDDFTPVSEQEMDVMLGTMKANKAKVMEIMA